MILPRIYYAHPTSLCGSLTEERDVTTLQRMGFVVINPAESEHGQAYRQMKEQTGNGMPYFFRVIDTCHLLMFRAFPDGKIGAGVHAEIKYAQGCGKPIFEIPTNVDIRRLNIDETLKYLDFFGGTNEST